MIKVIKHSAPEYETNCCCGAILQFREDDIDEEDDGLKSKEDNFSLSFFCKSKLLFFF